MALTPKTSHVNSLDHDLQTQVIPSGDLVLKTSFAHHGTRQAGGSSIFFWGERCSFQRSERDAQTGNLFSYDLLHIGWRCPRVLWKEQTESFELLCSNCETQIGTPLNHHALSFNLTAFRCFLSLRNVFTASGRHAIEDGAAAKSGGGRQERSFGSWPVFWFLNNTSSPVVSKPQPTREEQIGNTDLRQKLIGKGIELEQFVRLTTTAEKWKKADALPMHSRKDDDCCVHCLFWFFWWNFSCRQRERTCSHMGNICIAAV